MPPAPVPVPVSRAPEVLAEPVELARGAGGAGLMTILGTGATAALGTALRPSSPDLPLSGLASGGGGGGGLTGTVTVKLCSTACSTEAVAPGANALASA